MAEKTVSELARETLMQLIKRKLAPTPANYSSVFNELGRLPNNPPFPLEELRRIAKSLPTWSPGQQKQRALLEYAVSQLNWKGVQDALMAYGQLTPRSNGPETSGVGALGATDAASPVSTDRPADRVRATCAGHRRRPLFRTDGRHAKGHA